MSTPGFQPKGYAGGGENFTLIFDPSVGASSGNVYKTAAEIAVALDSVNGAANVYVKGSAILPTGVTWDFGGYGGLYTFYGDGALEVQGTGQILDAQAFVGIVITATSETTPCLQWSDFSAGPGSFWSDAFLFLSSVTTVSPIQVPAGGNLGLLLDDGSGFAAQGGNMTPFVTLGGAGASFELQAFRITVITPIPSTLVSGGVGTTFTLTGDGSAFPIPSFTLFTGTLNLSTTDGPFAQTGSAGTVITQIDDTASVVLAGGDAANADTSLVMAPDGTSYAGMHEGCLVIGTSGEGEDISGQNALGFSIVGSVSGAAGGESVVLTNGITGDSIAIPSGVSDGVAVRLDVKAVAVCAPFAQSAEWTYRVLVRCDGGILSLVGTTGGSFAPEISSGSDAALWTLVPSVSGSDNFLNFTFTNGASSSGLIVCSAELDTNLN